MHELGQLLKEERLKRGLSLEDLQESTKIRKRYLEAIEEGNFKVLPGNFYVRAFVKNYAEAVGLDPNELLKLYHNVLPSTEPELAAEPITRSRVSTKASERWGRVASGIMLWAFLILIIALIWFFVSKYNVDNSGSGEDSRITDQHTSDINNPDSTYSPSPSTPTPNVTPEPTPTPTPQPKVEFVRSEGGRDYYVVNGSDTIKIEVKGIGNRECWIGLESPVGHTLTQFNLAAGEEREWELNESAYIVIGAPPEAQLIVNGTEINVGDTYNPKRIQFDFAEQPAEEDSLEGEGEEQSNGEGPDNSRSNTAE
ncbi:helix-turn-helix domain-containing protein [Paenibacillus senegalensis]|uniref:helix-turn-helix domain-containing protein n=1 Tax=Paenibacillus senegalensis TaxID=1465766 RepID=UPI000287D6AD|nr:RodZ domain-containing protein [Paenibacillus senegalensis]